MPSGRTHDSITLWSLPLIAALTFDRTRSSSLTLMVSAGFLFAGLMFGPDLDIYSRQYLRWGVLRWIWLPYRQNMRHRSFLSHGPIVGTIVRVGYLLTWLGMVALAAILISAIAYQLVGKIANWQILAQNLLDESVTLIRRSLQQNAAEWIALLIGLELGALSHSLSDWVGSWYKRLKNSRPSSPSPPRSNPSELPKQLPDEFTPEEPLELPDMLPPSIRQTSQLPPEKRSPKPTTTSVPPHLKRIPRLPPFGK
ncbi:metal-binding protein [Kovacikia minuta CCNUW1]|uniref:metal-binding protein n=1 Tax=Kovacikia minuta TaxID=2931930 RepID=UPI001CCFB096|nr:metal-binding protein [Kovacikia minuta]UBF24165.1 metal-binding protein [Kovacikia minuta CCNUW1]